LYHFSLIFSPSHSASRSYTLSLHDALPISGTWIRRKDLQRLKASSSIVVATRTWARSRVSKNACRPLSIVGKETVCRGSRAFLRSEEHTSELQSREHLVCRLLLEKKNPPCS